MKYYYQCATSQRVVLSQILGYGLSEAHVYAYKGSPSQITTKGQLFTVKVQAWTCWL